MSGLIVDDPYTGETACTVEATSDAALGRVLDDARAAARTLARLSVEERAALCDRAHARLEARSEEVAADITRQMGKPRAQARGEVKGMADRWRHIQSIAQAALADVVLAPKDVFERRIVKEP